MTCFRDAARRSWRKVLRRSWLSSQSCRQGLTSCCSASCLAAGLLATLILGARRTACGLIGLEQLANPVADGALLDRFATGVVVAEPSAVAQQQADDFLL